MANSVRNLPNNSFEIVDISQPVDSNSACFPGDTPFSKDVTLTYKDSGIVNLTAYKMSPHVGTHADAPVHIQGDFADGKGAVSDLPLDAYLGEVMVLDLTPHSDAISVSDVMKHFQSDEKLPERILFKTRHQIRYDVFENDYSYIGTDLAEMLGKQGVKLIGLDTPSVDHVDSKTLESHHILLDGGLVWLENLDLTKASAGKYFLVALPLKMQELEAAPVRAVLLK